MRRPPMAWTGMSVDGLVQTFASRGGARTRGRCGTAAKQERIRSGTGAVARIDALARREAAPREPAVRCDRVLGKL